MKIIVAQTKYIMLVAGLLTCTMIYAVFLPQEALFAMFGVTIEWSPVIDIVARSWGVLVSLIGVMLIFGAYHEIERPFILIIAGVSKIAFVGLLIVLGDQYFSKTATTLIMDLLAVSLFVICFPHSWRESKNLTIQSNHPSQSAL